MFKMYKMYKPTDIEENITSEANEDFSEDSKELEEQRKQQEHPKVEVAKSHRDAVSEPHSLIFEVKNNTIGKANECIFENSKESEEQGKQTELTKKQVAGNLHETKSCLTKLSLVTENQVLCYNYEKELCILKEQDLSSLKKYIYENADKDLEFVKEPQNKYDSQAVAVCLAGQKIGYVYRGQTQDMINDWISSGHYFRGYISSDSSFDQVLYKIGFYKPIDKMKQQQFQITGISKKDTLFGDKRSEALARHSDGDWVVVDYDNESEIFIVSDDCNFELGELSKTATETIRSHNTRKLGQLVDLNIDIDGKTSCNIVVYH